MGRYREFFSTVESGGIASLSEPFTAEAVTGIMRKLR